MNGSVRKGQPSAGALTIVWAGAARIVPPDRQPERVRSHLWRVGDVGLEQVERVAPHMQGETLPSSHLGPLTRWHP
jgi:hypothetical protein